MAMSGDPNKKSPRSFQCRDALWEKFEQMARELECSVDYLVNDAMKQYARQRTVSSSQNESSPAGGFRSQSFSPGPPPSRLPPPPVQARTSGGLPLPPPRGGSVRPPQMGSSLPLPPPPRNPSAPPPQVQPRSGHASTMVSRTTPPPIPGGMASSSGMQLAVIYNGERQSISKERFVIGRGKQSSDLTLKDPNVSRQHAMVEFQNGAYFMVDMGSTNGVEYNGQRIARRQIAEGDTFRICDHDLRFTFRS